MKSEDKHRWIKQPNDDEFNKRWLCEKCGCKKILGNYKFATPQFNRSGQSTDYRPECVDMGRRSNEPLD